MVQINRRQAVTCKIPGVRNFGEIIMPQLDDSQDETITICTAAAASVGEEIQSSALIVAHSFAATCEAGN